MNPNGVTKRYAVKPVSDCLGARLAHALSGLGADGRRFKLAKGALIDQASLAQLLAAGINQAAVIEPVAGDLFEAEAAQALAQLFDTQVFDLKPAPGGRLNLYAKEQGLFLASAERVNQLNAMDEGLGLATLADESLVHPGTLVASLKIIPFFIAQASLDAALKINGLVDIAPFQAMTAGLIQTKLDHLKPSVLNKTEEVMRQRLATVGISLSHCQQLPHDARAITAALQAAQQDLVLLMGASAVCDRGDLLPTAIEAAGGQILHFGMPVDPGNLLVLGKRGDQHILVLPGCARSPEPNGTDKVLARLAACLPVTSQTIMGYGVGGLLKETASRGLSRENHVIVDAIAID